MEIYVSKESRGGDGTKEYPLNSLAQAAIIAKPGDEVIVAPGVYREYVNPAFSGMPERRIIYRSAVKNGAVITGAEEVKNWERYKENVWMARIPNGIFGEYNPYTVEIFGDWYDAVKPMHTGEIYINNKALYETDSLEEVLHPIIYKGSWDQKGSLYKWYTVQEQNETVIYANFQELNPNEENVEMNVRRNCFYPSEEGIGYITVSGFTITKAATQWAPPTAYQEGMIGPHWSKGWIIEDCDISHSRCSGISLGKYLQPENDNKWAVKHTKTGTQTERDAICQAQREGWTKENIGSHIIRRCNIHDCGQTGIVGHLGGVFSIIEDNDIHHINNKQDLAGAEIGGIKMHAAIDVIIRRNRFHHCTRGLWLDWQAQGTRVSKNLFYANDRDLMVEVTHGPYMVDNNIFGSEYNFDNIAQGGAYVNNLCCGTMRREPVLNRSTPYHFPHTTQVAGTTLVYGGDDRIYQNIFIGGAETYTEQSVAGTTDYNGSCTSLEEYVQEVTALGNGDVEMFEKVKQPVYINGNAYLKGAGAFDREKENYISQADPQVKIVSEGDAVYLEMNVEKEMLSIPTEVIDTQKLGMVRLVEAPFDDPDGNPVVLDTDYLGNTREAGSAAGAFADLKEGFNRFRVWG